MKSIRLSLNNVYLCAVTVIFLLVVACAVYAFLADYDVLISTISTSVHKNGLENKIRNEVFTRHRFEQLQQIIPVIFILLCLLYWLALRYRFYIAGICCFSVLSVCQCVRAIKQVFINNTSKQNAGAGLLFLIIALYAVYGITSSFLTYDEMWSYNYYTANHFYYSFFTYSNYPLFEMTTHFFKWLPFSMKINLRLSSFLFGMAACLLLYSCFRKYFGNHFTAMAGLAFFAFMPVTAGYMTVARGVIHELFFAIAGVFSFLFWIGNLLQKRWLVIYFLAAVLGVYAMPTHFLMLVFMLVAGLCVLTKKNKPAFFLFSKLHFFILAGILILYTPVFFTTVTAIYKSIISTKTAYSGVFSIFPYYLKNILVFYTGYSYIGLAFLLAGCVILLLQFKKIPEKFKLVAAITLLVPVSTACFYLITGLRYPGRSVAFGALIIPLLASLLVQLIIVWRPMVDNFWKNVIGTCVLVILIVSGTYYNYRRNINPVDKNVAVVSGLLAGSNILSCYDNSSSANQFYYYYPGIEYYYRQQHKTIELTLSAANSMRYKALKGISYDCIVYDCNTTDSSRAAMYHELYRDPGNKFKIWVRNDVIKKP